jgi:hypothetical protein
MTEHTSFSRNDEALPVLIDGALPGGRADALSARLETIISRLARVRAALTEQLEADVGGRPS